MNNLKAVKMTYALSDSGDYVSIEHVKNGLDCACVCVDCGGRLSAKQGQVNQWHFSHYNEADNQNCIWSGESELHFRVKNYLAKHMSLVVPIGFTKPRRLTLEFDEVVLEKSLRPSKRIPDVTCYRQGERFVIEVKVTHEVDRAKIADYKRINASAIELDFSYFNLLTDSISDEEIEIFLSKSLGVWLSVAPVGHVASIFQEHEREVTKSLIENNIGLVAQKKALSQDLKNMQHYIKTFKQKYDHCQAQMTHALNLLATTKHNTQRTKEEYLDSVESARTIFNVTRHQLEAEVIARLESENEIILERLRGETLEHLYIQHKFLLSDIDLMVDTQLAKKLELEDLEVKIEKSRGFEENLIAMQRRLDQDMVEFQSKEAQWKKAAQANATIKNHFTRLEPDLRAMCRKGGIPWPFHSSLVNELSPD